MSRWVTLLRGINVGGHNKIAMAELRAALSAVGLGRVETYIQSGNIVSDADEDPTGTITTTIKRDFAITATAISRPADTFREITNACPFDDAPNLTHVYLSAAPLELETLAPFEALTANGETIHAAKGVLYLNHPNGFAGSKLAASMEKLVGMPLTARNMKTMAAVLERALG